MTAPWPHLKQEKYVYRHGTVKASCTKSERNGNPYVGSRFLVVVLVVAAFGPYIIGPLRTEQIAVYGLAPLLLLTFARLKPWATGIISAWIAGLLAATVGQIFRYQGHAIAGPGSLLSGYESLLTPFIIMMLVWTLVPIAGASRVLHIAARFIVALSSLNALVAIATLLNPELVNLLSRFWTSGDAGEWTVAGNAMIMGRYSGIFNQPAEAGLVYSLAAVLAVWLYAKRPFLMMMLLSIITIGGMLSVSKIFILVGLPITFLLAMCIQTAHDRLKTILGAVFLAVFLSTATFFQAWDGLGYLTRLIDIPEHQSVVQFYSAGRWNDGSVVLQISEFILGNTAVFGMGVSGMDVPYDSLWTESLVMGGLTMTAAMVIVFLLLIRAFRKITDHNLRFTAYAFWLVLVGSSFGIPAMTANRAATLIWIVAALLVAISARANEKDGNSGVI